MRKEFLYLNIWSNIDPLKVKQRIETITARLERVQRQFDTQVEADNSSIEKKS
ncbi:MAG TPA: hypothetical protein V6D43_10285 [Candidatus Sericytochromatia bacterium]|jgi:hypothetical protein